MFLIPPLYLSNGHGGFSASPGRQKAYVVGEGALIHELYKAGLTITDVNPDFVIVGETRSFNWEMMHKAAFCRQRRALYRH